MKCNLNLILAKIESQFKFNISEAQDPEKTVVWVDSFNILQTVKNETWSSGNAFVSEAQSRLRFKSRAGQIGHSVPNGSPPPRRFFENCVTRAQ